MSAPDRSEFGPPLPGGTPTPPLEYFANPILTPEIAEVERLRGILSETERAIAGLVGVIGMDYDPDLHPADTLQLFEQALCDRLDNPV
jgi:hypothetical protein